MIYGICFFAKLTSHYAIVKSILDCFSFFFVEHLTVVLTVVIDLNLFVVAGALIVRVAAQVVILAAITVIAKLIDIVLDGRIF